MKPAAAVERARLIVQASDIGLNVKGTESTRALKKLLTSVEAHPIASTESTGSTAVKRSSERNRAHCSNDDIHMDLEEVANPPDVTRGKRRKVIREDPESDESEASLCADNSMQLMYEAGRRKKRAQGATDDVTSHKNRTLSPRNSEEESDNERGNVGEPECLSYTVASSVEASVLAGRFVPVYKLLAGYRPVSAPILNCINGSAEIRMTEGNDNRRLERQILDLGQLIIGLQKYKFMISNVYPERTGDLDRHISNVVYISVTYTGNAYFIYHSYVWSTLFGSSARFWGKNWFTLDSAALHAAIARAHAPVACDLCPSWSHAQEKCPFTERDIVAPATRTPARMDALLVPSQRKGKMCEFFNSKQGCRMANRCNFAHVCSFCESKLHAINSCHDAPARLKV